MRKTVLFFLILFTTAYTTYAQFPTTQPVELGNMYTDWYPDIKLADQPAFYPAVVSTGILTEEQFVTVLKNSVANTRPDGFNSKGDDPAFYVLLRTYKAYKIAEWVWTSKVDNYSTQHFALVWIPLNENKHMPKNLQPISPDGMFLAVKPSTLKLLKPGSSSTNTTNQPNLQPASKNVVAKPVDPKPSSLLSSSPSKAPKGPAYEAVVKAYFKNNLNEVVEKMPAYEKLYPNHLYTVFFKAWIADQTGNDMDGALRSYSEIIRKDSLFAEALVWRSKAFWNKGLDDRAIADITNAIRMQGGNTPAYYFTFRADYHNSVKNYTAALADFKQAIKIAPEVVTNYIGFMNVAFASGNSLEAEKVLVAATSGIQKDNPGIHLVHADYLLRSQRFKEADAVFTKALAMSGTAPTGADYNNASIAAYKLREYSKATVLSEKAMAAAPKKAEFIFNRASIAIDQQRWEEVYQLAQKALAIDANSAYANMLMAIGVKRTGRGDALSAEYEAKAKRLAAAGN